MDPPKPEQTDRAESEVCFVADKKSNEDLFETLKTCLDASAKQANKGC